MITIKQERCTGCGACLDICPHGALYLLEGKAVVDETLCRECEACVAACPEHAILVAETPPQAAAVPAVRPEPEIIRIKTEPALVTVRQRAGVLPAVGAALAWAGREIVPWLADMLLDTLDRQATRPQARDVARSRETQPAGARGSGRQRRHRRRGGGR